MSSTEPDGPPDVVFFWRPGCRFCRSLRRGLHQAGVTVEARNIWKDPAAAAFVRSVAGGNETVPTVLVGRKALVNPSVSAVLARLGRSPEGRDDGWNDYLTAFHAEHPGITEAVLSGAAGDDGSDPYDWLAQALPGAGVIVDMACGSGPLATRIGGGWIGIDRSPGELRRAASVAAGRVALADAASSPVRTGGADAVVCSMALMLFDNPSAVLAEITHQLRAGGTFVALLPATSPLTVRDRMRYARLLGALRLRTLPFRHHHVLDDPRPLLAEAGLTLMSAQTRRFAHRITSAADACQWMRSLYLPDVEAHHVRAAERITRRWAGSSIGLPLRRLVASKDD